MPEPLPAHGPGRVAVVTDSSCGLTLDEARRLGVTVVPLQLGMGDDTVPDDEAHVTASGIVAAQREGVRVTTSRPAPETFARVYRDLAAGGAGQIVSLHLSGALSGTVDAARTAAAQAPVPVEVVDTRLAAMGLGFTVARVAGRSWPDAAAARDAALAFAGRITVLFGVDSLEHLMRGGRIGLARGWAGRILGIRPLLELAGGAVRPREKIRTHAALVRRMGQLAVAEGARLATRVRVAVQHTGDPEAAEALAAAVRASDVPVDEVTVCDLPAVVIAHTGPGTLGVVVAPLR